MAGHVAGHQPQKPPPCDDAHTSRWSRRGDCQYLFFVTTAVIGRVSDAELACCARAFDEAATIMPSTDSGVSTATQPGWPCSATSMCIWRYETIPAMRASSPRKRRRPPDPLVGTPAHRAPPRTSSPMSAGMYVAADSPLGHPYRGNFPYNRHHLNTRPHPVAAGPSWPLPAGRRP